MKKRICLSLGILMIIGAVCIFVRSKEVDTAVCAYRAYEMSEINKEKDPSTYTLHR